MTLDWLNSNSVRNYPIKDGLGRVSDNGLFTIPNNLIVDLSLCSSQAGDSPTLYVSRISVSNVSLLIEVSVAGYGVFGTFQTNLPFNDYNIDVVLTAGVAFPTATGVITLGSSDDLQSLPSGDFTFSATNTALLMRVFSPAVAGVSWISFNDTKGNSIKKTGYVRIRGNNNLQFREVAGVVYLDAGEGLGLNKICADIPTPILTINGVGPDDNGNFTLINGNCISIDDEQYGLLLANPCGQTCLGCDAIDTLTTQTNSLEAGILDLRAFASNLQNVITQATNLITIPRC